MEKKFKVGAVVKLKSGSPLMTIINDKLSGDLDKESTFDGRYECVWFVGNNERTDDFSQETLIIAE